LLQTGLVLDLQPVSQGKRHSGHAVGFVAEIAAHEARRPGERIDLDFDMNRAVLIDPAMGLVLT